MVKQQLCLGKVALAVSHTPSSMTSLCETAKVCVRVHDKEVMLVCECVFLCTFAFVALTGLHLSV